MEMYSPRLQFSEHARPRPRLANKVVMESTDTVRHFCNETEDVQMQQLFQRLFQSQQSTQTGSKVNNQKNTQINTYANTSFL